MKIRVPREPFLQGCRLADLVFPERVIDPGFNRFLLQAQDDHCVVSAVGNDVALRLEIPAVVEQPGEVLLPSRHAVAIVRETAAEELTLESSPGQVRTQGEVA